MTNALLRIGIRRRVRLVAPDARISSEEVEEFVTQAGASWGARRDVVASARLAASCLDATAVSGCATGPVTLDLGFDETRLDLRIAYSGLPLVLPERAPSAAEMLDDATAPGAAGELHGAAPVRPAARARAGGSDRAPVASRPLSPDACRGSRACSRLRNLPAAKLASRGCTSRRRKTRRCKTPRMQRGTRR